MDYKTRITPAKEEAVKALKDEFSQYNGYIFTDYRGMTVEQITKLRRTLMEKDAAFRVVKNRFAKIALTDLDRTSDEQLVGPTAIALVKGDEANTVAKDLFAIKKEGASIEVKGALLDGEFFSAEQIEALSKLPTRLELIASLMGTMKAPVQKLAATLLAYVEKNGGSVESASEEN
ncbi:MAG: 50S ribosomal protein L10 [Sphaerochaeta sp.]